MTTTANALKAKLAKSLAKPKHTPKAAPAPASISPDTAKKLSVSLHPTDLAKIEDIRRALAAQGHHLTVSEAIKLALRSVAISGDMAKHLAEIEGEDQRRSK